MATYTVQDEMAQVATNYFRSLFTISVLIDFSRVLEGIPISITSLMSLMVNFVPDEIKFVVDSMALLKALGKDGFSALFF